MTNDGVLDRLCGPTDLRALSVGQLSALAAEIRRRLIAEVSRRGEHLGPQPRRGRVDHRAAPLLRFAAT